MKLIQNNIHMERKKAQGCMQVPLEEDKVVPDQCPDVDRICFYHGEILVQEIRSFADYAMVKGEVTYTLLYCSSTEGSRLLSLKASIPFEEKMNMPGLVGTDQVKIITKLEDLRIQLINSRKINIQCLMNLCGESVVLQDAKLLVDIEEEKPLECKKVPVTYSGLVVSKKDVIRHKEEIEINATYPNIGEILFSKVTLGEMEYTLEEGRIRIKGEMYLFVLYEPEGEAAGVREFEKKILLSEEIDCQESKMEHMGDILFELSQAELKKKPDGDGEMRALSLEIAVSMDLKVYKEESKEVIVDVYSIEEKVDTKMEEQCLQKVKERVMGKKKIKERQNFTQGGKLLRILYSIGDLWQDSEEVVEGGILLKGSLMVKCLYLLEEDEAPYGSESFQIPYRYLLQTNSLKEGDGYEIRGRVEQLEVLPKGQDGLEVQAVLCFEALVMEQIRIRAVEDIQTSPMDAESLRQLPGMCIYTVQEGEDLWSIGKRYAVSVSAIMESNGLTTREGKKNQKLLLIKGR